MKLLFILFLIYINYGSTVEDYPNKRYLIKSIPNKVRPGMYKINYSSKYVNQRKLDEIAQQEYEDSKKYTVFVPIDRKVIFDVPDSLLFPNDLLPEQKSRVKKVLNDYPWSFLRRSRSKRSVDNNKTIPAKRRAAPRSRKVKPVRGKLGIHGKRKNKNLKKGSAVRQSQRQKGSGNKKVVKNKNKRSGRKVSRNKAKRNSQRSAINPKKSAINPNKSAINPKKSAINGTPGMARRLISALDATIEEYPYVVSIQKNREHWCAGALLNSRLIITTANCMWKGSQVTRMKVRVGSRYTHQGGQQFKIQEVMRHPGWKIRNSPDCDVALALLDGNVRFSHSVHAVDLPNHAMMPPFDDAWVTSWGSERRDGVFDGQSNSLQVYHVRLMNRDKCNNITERFRVSVTGNFVCLTQTGGRAPCTRDTGAPAVSDGVIWGLASWGIRKLCGTERYPAMFSYLASPANLDFITNATHLLMADERNYPYPDKWPRRRVTPTTPTPFTMPYK